MSNLQRKKKCRPLVVSKHVRWCHIHFKTKQGQLKQCLSNNLLPFWIDYSYVLKGNFSGRGKFLFSQLHLSVGVHGVIDAKETNYVTRAKRNQHRTKAEKPFSAHKVILLSHSIKWSGNYYKEIINWEKNKHLILLEECLIWCNIIGPWSYKWSREKSLPAVLENILFSNII